MEFLNNSSNIRVLIVGDVMLDRYWWGNVSRISPEAPVPVVNLEKISATPGGAANVAANVAGLGAKPFLIGVVGDDEEANLISEALTQHNISADFLLKSTERRTTVKTRIIAHNQQIVRVDRETKTDLNIHEENKVRDLIERLISQTEIIVISDYGKGMATKNILSRLITTCEKHGKYVFVDPKGKSYAKYHGATMLTPNRFEIAEVCNLEKYNQSAIEIAGSGLISELGLKYLLVTQGEEGMTLFEKEKKVVHLPVESRNVYDVTGAGDTVIACLAVAVGGGADFTDAARFANRAAGLVVGRVGTTAISLEMLNQ